MNLTPVYVRGALAQAFTSDRFGRRGSILIWAAIFTVGVTVQTGTNFSIVQITIGRFIAGLGVGALSGMAFSRTLFLANYI
jgi:SP family sugar:H+ symporter-like MFS transporter